MAAVTENLIRELELRVQGTVLQNELLAPYATYRIGGPASALLLPESPDDVVAALTFAAEHGLPWLALGLGSNVLVSDQGFDGLVLRFGKGLDDVDQEIDGDPAVWRVGAGLPTPLLARRSAKAGLAGVHRLVGVPGTVGGGVYMNAGAHGQDFASVVESVDLVDASGRTDVRLGHAVPWQYRSSGLGSAIVLGAVVRLEPQDPQVLQRDVQRHLAWRKAGTPFNEPCCGSVFRNPNTSGLPDDGPKTAGQLIDTVGLKGRRIGGAQVSELHANYIVNTGSASAADVMRLIDEIRERVLVAYGVELRLEVQVVGDWVSGNP
jgi:UDP-N-acetylmuramate dehydrogenase